MDTFIIKLILSFVVGSAWITATTVIADKYGTKLGGWFGGIPSTALIGLSFLGLLFCMM